MGKNSAWRVLAVDVDHGPGRPTHRHQQNGQGHHPRSLHLREAGGRVINILDALDDSQVFQPLFRTHSTWSTWRALEQEDLRQRGLV